MDVDGRSHWDVPNARVTGYIHLEILLTNTPGSRDRWQETWIAKRDRVVKNSEARWSKQCQLTNEIAYVRNSLS